MNAYRRSLSRIAAAALTLAPGGAQAADMAFLMTNRHAVPVAVELFGRDRVWPGDDRVYLLEGGERKSVPVSCEAGETICYGAWVAGDDTTFWGVGPDNDQDCDKCCSTCTTKGSVEIELTR